MRIVEYPKSEVEIEQEKDNFYPARWWRAVDAEGKLLAETSTRSDFVHLKLISEEAKKDGVTIQRLYERKEAKWVEEDPYPKVEEWRTISEFPLYEMTQSGHVRLIETKEQLQPTLIGDAGYPGFLLKKNVGVYLVGTFELCVNTFPEFVTND